MPLFGRPQFRPPAHPAIDFRPAPTANRQIHCHYCNHPLRVPDRALNTRCPACQKHLILEDIVIRGDCVKNAILTAGSILVEPAARFQGTLYAPDIVIAGRVLGTVIATQSLQITATGKIAGTIAAKKISQHPLALVDAQIHLLDHPNHALSA